MANFEVLRGQSSNPLIPVFHSIRFTGSLLCCDNMCPGLAEGSMYHPADPPCHDDTTINNNIILSLNDNFLGEESACIAMWDMRSPSVVSACMC